MKINNIHLRNIGPFKEAILEFPGLPVKQEGEQPVTIITGVNGAGKSILIDAIRAAFGGGEVLERNIVANEKDFVIEMELEDGGTIKRVRTASLKNGHVKAAVDFGSVGRPLMYGYASDGPVNDWVIDYWSSKTATDPFRIDNLTTIKHEEAMKGVMRGKKSHVALVNFICQMDYMRSSEVPEEKELGCFMFGKLKEMTESCLEEGTFKFVRRTDLMPIVEQNGIELSIDKLSSGNIFLLEHLLTLMCRMYSVGVLNHRKPEEMLNASGVLLIDEVETHLHPHWQKKIVGIIRRYYPNLQIILTTHSPFVVASMDGARIYTCVPCTGFSEVRDETEKYGHMPVDEVLMSEAFNVHPFNEQITQMLRKRKQLVEAGNDAEADAVGRELYKINPEYFSYLR